MRTIIIVVIVLAAGCSAPPAPMPCGPFQVISGDAELCIDGQRREVTLVVPERPDGTLIIALHGGGGWPARMQDQTDFEAVAPDAIVAYPAGTGLGTTGLFRTWNGVHCCGVAYAEDVDDVAFLAGLIAAVEADAGPQRVMVVGHSNGGMMAYRFASERPDLVDGVVAVAGTIGGRPAASTDEVRIAAPASAVPVLIIHGLQDEQVAYHGGSGNDTVGGRRDASVADAVGFWREANGATALGTRSEGAAGATIDAYPGNASVTLVTTPGAHRWPTADNVGFDATGFSVAWFYDL